MKRETNFFLYISDQISFWASWIGVITASVSAISTLLRITHTAVAPPLLWPVKAYRALVRPGYEWVNLPDWPVHVPPVSVDGFAVFLCLFGICTRYSGTGQRNERSSIRGEIAVTEAEVERIRGQIRAESDPAKRKTLQSSLEGEESQVKHWKRVLKSVQRAWLSDILLLPLLTLQPIRSFYKYNISSNSPWRNGYEKNLALSKRPETELFNPKGPYRRALLYKADLRASLINFLQFLTLPLIVGLFFLVNHLLVRYG